MGSDVRYKCQFQFPENLLPGLTGTAEISDPSGTPIDSTEGRVIVSESTTLTGNMFARTLHFFPLSADDS